MSELNLVLNKNRRKERESKSLELDSISGQKYPKYVPNTSYFLFLRYLKILKIDLKIYILSISGCRDWKLGRVDKMRVALVLALCVAVASASPFFGNLFGSRGGGSRARSGRSSHGHGGGWGMMMQQEQFFLCKN